MGIQVANLGQALIPLMAAGPTTLPYGPTTSAALVPAFVAPCNGRLAYAEIVVAVAAAAGDSTDLKETVKFEKRGVAGATGPTAISTEVAVADVNLAPDYLPAAGTVLKIPGLTGNHCVAGELLNMYWTETGTKGTGTRATFNVVKVVFEADAFIGN